MRPLRILRITLLVNLVLTLAAMTLAYRALRRANDLSRRVINSHRALQAAEETLRRTVDAETGARGFILTRNPADLERFRTGRQFVPRPLDELAAALAADGRQAAAASVRAAVTETIARLDRLVDHADASDTLQAGDSDAARESMDGVRALVRAVRRDENDILSDRMQQVERAGRRINWLLVVMTGVATALLTMLAAALVFVTRPGVWRP